MSYYKEIGHGYHEKYNYQVSVIWDLPLEIPKTIRLSKHTRRDWYDPSDIRINPWDSCFPLSQMLEDKWTKHLQICSCLRLRELAQQEKSLGRYFTADEIFDKWHYRVSPAVNLVGEVFGSLIVIGRDDSIQDAIWWICRCQCGEYRMVEEPQLVGGAITACVECEAKNKKETY